jgi:hypothetical protein
VTDCVDCQEPDGTCQWHGCQFDADYVLRDVTVKRGGVEINVGDVDVCGGHKRRAERLGRLELDWERVLRAVT